MRVATGFGTRDRARWSRETSCASLRVWKTNSCSFRFSSCASFDGLMVGTWVGLGRRGEGGGGAMGAMGAMGDEDEDEVDVTGEESEARVLLRIGEGGVTEADQALA